ncbi:hypothetical protein [Thalassospira sp.]|uniref:hypothetical protein n=1 Tax=Thalassospira sp. TaxID=1912094 RepID=UPI002735EDB6|nr:hypothetical protein [Thalassospira sp.]MDP2696632.1 hypothetical protein [Thalassospira sp.]
MQNIIKTENKMVMVRFYCFLFIFLLSCFFLLIAPLKASENITLCDQIGSVAFDKDRVSDPIPKEEYDPFKVVPACQEALSDSPDNPRFYFQLGIAMAMLLEVDKAVEHLEMSANKGYEAAKGFLKKYESKIGQETSSASPELNQNDNKPLNDCDRIGSMPIDVRRVGQPLPIEKYQPEKVVKACREALKGDLVNPRFHFQLGMALLGTGEVDDALIELQTAASRNYVAAKLVLDKFNEKSAK